MKKGKEKNREDAWQERMTNQELVLKAMEREKNKPNRPTVACFVTHNYTTSIT